MAYTDIDDPSKYFQTALYTGNGGTQAITNTGNSDLQPNWIWTKVRSEAGSHRLVDTVRGLAKPLSSNGDDAEADETNYSAFNSDGFSLVNESLNENNRTYVAWQWKAGTAVSGNTSGSGTAKAYSGSVNTDAGFSMITYIGNGTGGHAIPHHLGVAPKMIIAKNRVNGISWPVYHVGVGATKFFYLDTGNAAGESTVWNDTTPTSSVFTMNDTDNNNNAEANIAYCFAEKQGYSKIGSYTGNGNANGTFVYTGFKPAWILVKNSVNNSTPWHLRDSARAKAAPDATPPVVEANTNQSEADVGNWNTSFLSNGFKQRDTNAYANGAGIKYIYMAFAENPFVTSKGTPATAF